MIDQSDRAKRVLTSEVFDYFDGGAGRELTAHANVLAWQKLALQPHILRDVADVDIGVTLLGRRIPVPVAIAPSAFHALAHADAEPGVAHAAATRSLFVASARSSRPFSAIGSVAGPWWMQVYMYRDRSITEHQVRAAVDAGASAVVLTGDTPVLGRKRRNRDGFEIPSEYFAANLPLGANPDEAEQSAAVTFADIAWLRRVSGVPVVVKGVLRADDARRCVESGASAVIVSNHGGRQLDGAIATADALPAIAAALQGAAEVYVDGGIRDAVDVVRAIALGARGVFVGRPILWALACGGSDGVARYLDDFADELRHVFQLCGVRGAAEIDRSLVAGSVLSEIERTR